jgi:hypothetical protein
LEHRLQDSDDRALRNLQAGKIDKEQYDKKIYENNQVRNQPELQMQIAQEQIDYLSRFGNQGNPLFQSEITKGIKRWENKYNSAATALAKLREQKAKQDFELSKLEKEEAGKDRRTREKIEADTILKTEDILSREKVAKIRAAATKLTKSGSSPGAFEKRVRFLAEINPGMTLSEAGDIVRADETMAERLRAAAEEIEAIDPDDAMEYKEKAPLISAIHKKFGLDKASLRGLPPGNDEPTSTVPDWRMYQSRGVE